MSDGQVPRPVHVVLVIVACACYAGMLAAEQRWGGLSIRMVVGVGAVTMAVAVVVVPRFTTDLWSYTAYGRALGVHGVSPWTSAPDAFPHDPLLHMVGRTWRDTPSVYGPVFTLLSAMWASISGAGELSARLFYQGLAAVAVGGGAWLVWRRTQSAAAVAFLIVHPLVAMYLVNGGRNDILVGVAMLAAVVLAARGRPGAAGVVAALGALVKITGVVGIAALVVTMVGRGERRAAFRVLAAAGVVLSIGYFAAGTTALFAPMQTAGALYSRPAAWTMIRVLGLTRPDAHVALAVLALLVIAVIVRHARSRADTAVAGSLGMLSIAAAWTLPGYTAWALPAAALDHRSRVSRIVAGAGLDMVITYEILRHPIAGPAGSALSLIGSVGGPLILLVFIVLLLRTPLPIAHKGTHDDRHPPALADPLARASTADTGRLADAR
ncbi:MAG: glycosyltransferase 87 family protein [Acidimicrobiia bacterium]